MIQINKDSDYNEAGASQGLAEQARLYVLQRYNKQPDTRLVYHNYQRTSQMLSVLGEICHAQEIGEVIRDRAAAAAWLSM
ncbi:MAG: hypothetical protein AAFP19_10145, partial [Bacteroidota bacterium]